MALSIGSAVSRFKVSDGNLGLLQEYLRRDPESYRDEFMEQFQHFLQFVNLLELEPKLHRSSVEQLLEVVNFLTAVAFCYPEQSKIFGSKLVELLSVKAEELGHELRLAFCRALIALRNAQRMTAMDILPILFDLLKCDDKQLRKFIKAAVLSIIKHTKIGSKSQKRKSRRTRKVCHLGGAVTTRLGGATSLSAESAKIQAFVFAQLRDSCTTSARIAQNILVQAYRKCFWRDVKTANVLAECVFHKVQRVQLSTMRFFLGSVEDEEGDEANESDSENETRKDSASVLRDVVSSLKYGKKTKKREKDLDKAKREMGKSRKSKRESRAKFCNLEALSSIYDPQKFVDRLFGCLESKRNEKFVMRLLQIALCARLIGIHRLQTLGFYSYLHRYLQPKQREVTRILLYAAQSCHELVPPDLIENLVRRIAQNFVTDQNTPEAITVGLNTIREIFSTCPAAVTEELLRDLTEYKTYKNKNVSMAARALITLFRSVNPKLLHHKDRGRPTDDGGETLAMPKSNEFGALTTTDFVPGAEILSADAPAPEPEKAKRQSGKRARRAANELEDSEDEWVDVVSSEDELEDEGENDEDNSAVMTEADGEQEGEDDDGDEVEESDDEEESSGEWVTDSEGDEDAGSEDDDEGGWETCSDDEEEMDASRDDKSEKSSKAPKKAVEKKKVTFKLGKVVKKKTKMLEKAEAKRQALEKAKLVSESRILTDGDFRAIRVHQIRRQMAAEKRANNTAQRRTNDEVLLDEEIQEKFARRETGAGDGLPRLNDIEHFHKKIHRQNKAERLAQAEISHDERDNFGRPKKNGPHVGRTNRELAKRKNFQMVKQKMRGENRQRSFRDRQISLRNYLQKQAGKKVI